MRKTPITQKEPIEIEIAGKKAYLHYLTIIGSHLHGLTIKETSDTDIKGVLVWDDIEKSKLDEPLEIIELSKLKAEYGEKYKDIMKSLLIQLNVKLNLNLNPEEDDCVMYDTRKFFKDTMKNDFNMLDMLYSDMQIFVSEEFQKVLDIKNDFIKYQFTYDKFTKMGWNNLQKSKNQPEPLKFKSQVKAIQLLENLKVILETGEHIPLLPEKIRNKLMKIKKGEIKYEDIENHFKLMELDINEKYEIPQNELDREFLSKKLVDLNMFNINKQLNKSNKTKSKKSKQVL